MAECDEDPEYLRLIAVSHGMVHALVSMKQVRGSMAYAHHLPPPHHSRLRAAKLAKVEGLDKAIEICDRKLREVQAAYRLMEGRGDD